ncbi:MAG: hybrid sensor histidine kinase/response regulator [Thermodesulfobacteriota bacterium]
MEKSFISRIKSLFRADTPYLITRSFSLRMLPLSFLAGIFICIAIPASYYYLGRANAGRQAAVHANYIASIFREVLEKHPLAWKEEINTQLAVANITRIEIFDRNNNLIAELTSGSLPAHRWSMVASEQKVTYGGSIYALVKVGISLEKLQNQTLMLLLFSLACGTFEGIALFLLPIFKIQDAEEQINRSHRKLLDEQQKLKTSEEKFRTFFEFAPDGTVISTASGRILSCNHAFREMFQIDEKDFRSRNAKDFYFDPRARERLLAELFEVGEVKNMEVVFRKKDGSELPALVSMKLFSSRIIKEEDGLPENENVLLQTIIRDISEKKEVEKQLAQAHKLQSIGLLAGGVAHDFNNILSGMMGYAGLIRLQTPADKDVHQYAKIIEKAAIRGSDLTRKLLAFARGGKYLIEDVNLNEIAEEVLEILAHTIEKKIVILKDFDPDLRNVRADASQMNQVLLNLCINARDAMTGRDRCELLIKTFSVNLQKRNFSTGEVCQPGEYVGISVSDTGSGMSQDLLSKIFDPFFSTKGKGQGTGLGLSMVYGIIRNHDGYIDVISKPGKGSTFVIYLPAALAREAGRGDKAAGPDKKYAGETPGGTETILLVDDEAEVRNFTKVLLGEKGYHVLLAEDGEDAVAVYRTNRDTIDLVLLDMIMPKKNGAEVFYELRKMNPEVKVIIVSGFSMDYQARQLLKDGAAAFIQKPYRTDKLLLAIRELFAQQQPGRH